MAMPPKKPMMPKGKPMPKKPSAQDDYFKKLHGEFESKSGAFAPPPPAKKGAMPSPRKPTQGKPLPKGAVGEAFRIMGPGDKPKGKKKK